MTGSGAARDRILARIRAATSLDGAVSSGRADPAGRGSLDDAYAALPRGYLPAHHDPAACNIVDLFAERAADYRAVVEQVPASGLAGAVARILADRAAACPGPFVVPDGLPEQWLAGVDQVAAIGLTGDSPPLSAADLDRVAGVVTGCAVAIAETGTIILEHGPGSSGQGRRALTLVPDFHLAVVCAAQVAADLPGALARLNPARPHTLISGPSATSDIELIRVEGVHGPRQLHVLLASSETETAT